MILAEYIEHEVHVRLVGRNSIPPICGFTYEGTWYSLQCLSLAQHARFLDATCDSMPSHSDGIERAIHGQAFLDSSSSSPARPATPKCE